MRKETTCNPEQLAKLLEQHAVTLIDVREVCEFKSNRIATAKNIPLSALDSKKEVLLNSSKPTVLYCLSGRRSGLALERLKKHHPDYNLMHLEGGIRAFEEQGFAIQRSDKQILPLDRQTQIVIGMMIISGIVLAQTVTPWGHALTAMAGLGLINAGITGWCGMLKVVAKMPWNRA